MRLKSLTSPSVGSSVYNSFSLCSSSKLILRLNWSWCRHPWGNFKINCRLRNKLGRAYSQIFSVDCFPRIEQIHKYRNTRSTHIQAIRKYRLQTKEQTWQICVDCFLRIKQIHKYKKYTNTRSTQIQEIQKYKKYTIHVYKLKILNLRVE